MSKQPTERLAEGLALQKAGQFSEAETIYQELLRHDPGQPLLHSNRALALQAMGLHDDALASHNQAAALGADIAEIHYNRGVTLQALKRFSEALASYDRAIALKADYVSVHNNRGNTLRELKRHKEALEAYDRAIALRPDFADAHNNRGNALRSLRRHEEALAAYNQAIVLKPDFASAYYNLGFTLQEMKRYKEALAAYDRAIAIAPDYADAQWSKGFIALLLGDYTNGWPLYEWRWKRSDIIAPRRELSQPAWHGDFDIKGKTILLYAEQGLGDTIQFCRYAKRVADRGAKIILEVPPTLKSLMTSLKDVQHIIAQAEPLPPFDYHCALLSLPLAFKTELNTIPAPISYLHAPSNAVSKWTSIFGERRAPRVGIAWAGSPEHKNDRNRSMKLLDLLPLAARGVELVSLQKDMPRAEAVILAATPVIKNIGATFENFSDTAAIIEQLDLVITVDTAIAHVAGALGKPVWILLPFAPEWRWLLDRSTCPWYPTARLFRQTNSGDWSSVVDEVGEQLQQSGSL